MSPRCGLSPIIFDGTHTLVFQGGPGISGSNTPATLARWSDGDTSGGGYTGFGSPPVQFTAATSPIVDLSFATPQDRIRGLREWNQGGSDLGDLDGFSSWTFEFFAGATSLTTGTMTMGNGGAPFSFLLPGNQELDGVTRVRLSDMRKLNPGATAAPLVRDVQALQFQPTFACRRRNGTLEWYVSNGLQIPASDVVPCP